MRKNLNIYFSIALTLLISGFVIYKTHPIVLKWLTGTARNIGRPINATVYTDGKKSSLAEVYHVNKYWNGEKTDKYILRLLKFDKSSDLQFISLDLKEMWVGRPSCTSNDCYDIVSGYLFQSETGSKSSPFQDDNKGFNFDPQLKINGKEINFKVPPGHLPFNSIEVVLN